MPSLSPRWGTAVYRRRVRGVPWGDCGFGEAWSERGIATEDRGTGGKRRRPTRGCRVGLWPSGWVGSGVGDGGGGNRTPVPGCLGAGFYVRRQSLAWSSRSRPGCQGAAEPVRSFLARVVTDGSRRASPRVDSASGPADGGLRPAGGTRPPARSCCCWQLWLCTVFQEVPRATSARHLHLGRPGRIRSPPVSSQVRGRLAGPPGE